MARYGQEKASSVPRLSRHAGRGRWKKTSRRKVNDGTIMTEPPLLIPVDASPFHHLEFDTSGQRWKKRGERWRERESGEDQEREGTGENLLPCFSLSFFCLPLSFSPVRSSILRHSRRGLITAYHCCHGNSRSVKNLSALTLIVRLKFHGERVEFTLRTIDSGTR